MGFILSIDTYKCIIYLYHLHAYFTHCLDNIKYEQLWLSTTLSTTVVDRVVDNRWSGR